MFFCSNMEIVNFKLTTIKYFYQQVVTLQFMDSPLHIKVYTVKSKL